ncbi:HAD-IA family hydrolase [Actinoalloteichus sp. GBA129-24]|uniref:HAD-IA family hydrolase n=1 Tax=Actinoalloteichus sp. GBA129-24 TaxID=1612551 RepID=UPI00095052A5|nr:HAD-IA family hydrolase [Actinoalloteichus sp. GBA129-24]APU22294.1 hydrolase [Actinoalloteichus sp. GBA129-24]
MTNRSEPQETTTRAATDADLGHVVSALLIDMDGTLVDSTAVVERTWRDFAERHGLDVERIIAVSHGRRTIETVAMFAPDGVDVAAEARWIDIEETEDTEGVVEVPGAGALLASLPEGSWALVTSAGRRLAERRMAAAGLGLPSIVITSEDVASGKPSPEGYLVGAHRLGVPADSTLVFEDAEAGVTASLAAGARTVVVGALDAPVTAGLDRVPDLRAVRVDPMPGSALLRVRLGSRRGTGGRSVGRRLVGSDADLGPDAVR